MTVTIRMVVNVFDEELLARIAKERYESAAGPGEAFEDGTLAGELDYDRRKRCVESARAMVEFCS